MVYSRRFVPLPDAVSLGSRQAFRWARGRYGWRSSWRRRRRCHGPSQPRRNGWRNGWRNVSPQPWSNVSPEPRCDASSSQPWNVSSRSGNWWWRRWTAPSSSEFAARQLGFRGSERHGWDEWHEPTRSRSWQCASSCGTTADDSSQPGRTWQLANHSAEQQSANDSPKQ
jgi:hypothetical protein